MIPQLVHVSDLRLRLRRNHRIIIILHNSVGEFVLEPPLKIKRGQVQALQLLAKEIHIPAALVALVIYQPEGFHLLRGEILHAYAGDLLHAQLLRSQRPAMADNYHAVTIDDYRLHKPILLDALRNIRNLRSVVLLRILGVRDQILHTLLDDFHGVHPITAKAPGVPRGLYLNFHATILQRFFGFGG